MTDLPQFVIDAKASIIESDKGFAYTVEGCDIEFVKWHPTKSAAQMAAVDGYHSQFVDEGFNEDYEYEKMLDQKAFDLAQGEPGRVVRAAVEACFC